MNCITFPIFTFSQGSQVAQPLAMSVTDDGLNDIYEALDRYNWDDDIEFQAGLQAIIGSNSTPEQTTELALRARCFYYARYDQDLKWVHPTEPR